VSPADDHALPGGLRRDQLARPAGLLEKLLAAVRPEFRQDVLAFGPADPVFGGPLCKVPGCGRTGRIRGLCTGHDHRWRNQGRPGLGEFTATTDPRLKGHQKLASCRAPGCLYGRKERGLCTRHLYAWQRAERPDLDSWLAGLPADAPEDPARGMPDCLLRPVGPRRPAVLPFPREPLERTRPAGHRGVRPPLRGRLGPRPRAHRSDRPGRAPAAGGAVRPAGTA